MQTHELLRAPNATHELLRLTSCKRMNYFECLMQRMNYFALPHANAWDHGRSRKNPPGDSRERPALPGRSACHLSSQQPSGYARKHVRVKWIAGRRRQVGAITDLAGYGSRTSSSRPVAKCPAAGVTGERGDSRCGLQWWTIMILREGAGGRMTFSACQQRRPPRLAAVGSARTLVAEKAHPCLCGSQHLGTRSSPHGMLVSRGMMTAPPRSPPDPPGRGRQATVKWAARH